MRLFTTAERRARLGRRHGLARPVATPEEATRAVLVLHASDPASVYLSSLARTAEPALDALADAVYERRTLVRVLAMRRTLFVVPRELLAVVERSSSDAVAVAERNRLLGFLADTGIEDPEDWLAGAAAEVAEALDPSGPGAEGLTARSLTAAVPRLATKILMGAGTRHPVTAGATSRTLAVLANDGVLLRGRPTGAWTGRTYRWHLRDAWLDGGVDGDLGPDPAGGGAERPGPDGRQPEALGPIGAEDLDGWSAALLERWLERFGPAPLSDLAWWTGWTKTRVRAALARMADLDRAPVEVELEGGDLGLVLPDDLDEEPEPEPWVALLPSLDPTAMGWKERAWYLGRHQGPLFDRNGNIGPTIWVDGRIVGGWSQTADGTVVTGLLEDVGSARRAQIEAEAARLTDLLDGTAVKPSFPTPLQKELATG